MNILWDKYKRLDNKEKAKFLLVLQEEGISYYNWYVASKQKIGDMRAKVLFAAGEALNISLTELQKNIN